MTKINHLDILQKDHGTGPIKLVHELECNSEKGMIRLLDQVQCQGKDNEVLVRYHVPELKENFNKLEDAYAQADYERYVLKDEIDLVNNQNAVLKLEKDFGIDEAYTCGFKNALKDTLFFKIEPPEEKPEYFAWDSLWDIRNRIAEDKKNYKVIIEIEKEQKDKTVKRKKVLIVPDFGAVNKNQALGAFIDNLVNSENYANIDDLLDRRKYPLYDYGPGLTYEAT